MRIPSRTAYRPHRLTCPLCDRGVLDPPGNRLRPLRPWLFMTRLFWSVCSLPDANPP